MATEALIVVFAEPVESYVAEELLGEIEERCWDIEAPFHVEHFTELRAMKLMGKSDSLDVLSAVGLLSWAIVFVVGFVLGWWLL